jgi:hypothetical protein
MSKGKAIRRMLAYLKPHKRQILMIWAMMLVGLCFSLVPAYLTRPLTDQVLNPVEAPLPINERLRLLGWLVIILVGAQLFGLECAPQRCLPPLAKPVAQVFRQAPAGRVDLACD